MEILILVLVAIGAIETTYLVYQSRTPKNIDTHSLLLDTSVLIDGRILPVVRSGLVTAPLVIPRSVVRELQYMADKADHEKRERARSGLDMIEQLQAIEDVTVKLVDDPELKNGGVDERLVELAKSSGARLCTIDYNLNKAARVQGVKVVNVNELAHALRVVHLPGETVELKLVQPGAGIAAGCRLSGRRHDGCRRRRQSPDWPDSERDGDPCPANCRRQDVLCPQSRFANPAEAKTSA